MNEWKYPFTVTLAEQLQAIVAEPIPSLDAYAKLKDCFWTPALFALMSAVGDVPDVRQWVVEELLGHVEDFLLKEELIGVVADEVLQAYTQWQPEAIGVCQNLIDEVLNDLNTLRIH